MELPDTYYLEDLIKGTHNIITQGNIYKYFTVLILYERYNLDNGSKTIKRQSEVCSDILCICWGFYNT